MIRVLVHDLLCGCIPSNVAKRVEVVCDVRNGRGNDGLILVQPSAHRETRRAGATDHRHEEHADAHGQRDQINFRTLWIFLFVLVVHIIVRNTASCPLFLPCCRGITLHWRQSANFMRLYVTHLGHSFDLLQR